VQQILVVKDF